MVGINEFLACIDILAKGNKGLHQVAKQALRRVKNIVSELIVYLLSQFFGCVDKKKQHKLMNPRRLVRPCSKGF